MSNGQMSYLSDDPSVTPENQSRGQAQSSTSNHVRLRANLVIDQSAGYQSATGIPKMQILQPINSRAAGEQQQQIYILSDAESINDGGQAKPIHAIVHTQRNSGTLPKAAKELRQSNTNRSLTLQSQGARSIGLN